MWYARVISGIYDPLSYMRGSVLRLILGTVDMEVLSALAKFLLAADTASRFIPVPSSEPLLLLREEGLSEFEDRSPTAKIPKRRESADCRTGSLTW